MQLQSSELLISEKDFTVLKLLHILGTLPYSTALREILKNIKNSQNHRSLGMLFQKTEVIWDSHHKNLEKTTSAEDILIGYQNKMFWEHYLNSQMLIFTQELFEMLLLPTAYIANLIFKSSACISDTKIIKLP